MDAKACQRLFERIFFAGLLWIKSRSDSEPKALFSVTGVEIEDQCPCLVDKDGSVDGVRYLVQAAHKSGARFRWTATRAGASLPRFSSQHMELRPAVDVSGQYGADFIRRVFPSIAACAGDSTLADSNIVVLSGWVSKLLKLHEAQPLADGCLARYTDMQLGASQAARVVAMGELGERAVVADLSLHSGKCWKDAGGSQLPQLPTVLPLPSGVSDYALSAACTSAGEDALQGLAAPPLVARLLRKRRRSSAGKPQGHSHYKAQAVASPTCASEDASNESGCTGHRSGAALPSLLASSQVWHTSSSRPVKNGRVAPMSTVTFECLRNGLQVAWVPEMPHTQ